MAKVFTFGECILDCERSELTRAGHRIKLERKAMELLTLLVTSKGRLVTRADIAAALWKPDVFVDVDPGINTLIRKVRYALRDNAEEPSYIETVSGKGYRFVAEVRERGAPADFIANDTSVATLELPDNGTTFSTETTPARRKRQFVRWLAGAAVCVLLAIAVGWLASGRKPRVTSLAVLPLDNLSGDPSQDYFADGMTDEVITMLTKYSNLRVVSRTSVMQYKRAHQPLPEVAQRLRVDSVLEGSVARSNGEVHMTVQLIDARSDSHLWAESFDRDTNASVSLPRDVAQLVAKQLHSSRSQDVAGHYVRPEAHDAYLRGSYLLFRGHNDEAEKYFRSAITMQPDYALAWTGLADVIGQRGAGGERNPKECFPMAKTLALKAMALDGSLAEAHISLCRTDFGLRDIPQALSECARAIELNPNLEEAYHFRAEILAVLNRHTEAIALERKASELDLFARPWALPRSLQWARRYEAATEEANSRLASDPFDIGEWIVLSNVYRCEHKWKDEAWSLQRISELSGDTAEASSIASDFKRGGYEAVVHGELRRLKEYGLTHYVSPVELSGFTAQLGQREPTLDFLENGFKEDDRGLLFIQCDCAYDFLHSDERYRSLVNKLGLPPAY